MIQFSNIIQKKIENLVEGLNQAGINHDRTSKPSATSMITIIIFLSNKAFMVSPSNNYHINDMPSHLGKSNQSHLNSSNCVSLAPFDFVFSDI